MASDGRQALESALAQQPAVLVLDLMLPELDGYEVLRRLRADPKGENLSVLMLTASIDTGEICGMLSAISNKIKEVI